MFSVKYLKIWQERREQIWRKKTRMAGSKIFHCRGSVKSRWSKVKTIWQWMLVGEAKTDTLKDRSRSDFVQSKKWKFSHNSGPWMATRAQQGTTRFQGFLVNSYGKLRVQWNLLWPIWRRDEKDMGKLARTGLRTLDGHSSATRLGLKLLLG